MRACIAVSRHVQARGPTVEYCRKKPIWLTKVNKSIAPTPIYAEDLCCGQLPRKGKCNVCVYYEET